MINLHVKFNVHSSYAKQVIVLKVADGRTDGRTDAPGDDNRHPPKFWLKPKKRDTTSYLDKLMEHHRENYVQNILNCNNTLALSQHCNNARHKHDKVMYSQRQPKVLDASVNQIVKPWGFLPRS